MNLTWKTILVLGLVLGLAALPAKAVTWPNDTAWEVQNGGSDSNGGCFAASQKGATGTDHTYPTSSPVSFTSTLSATATTSLTDSGAGFDNTMLGNCVQISGQGTYVIVGFTSSSVVTVDRTLGTFSTTSGVVGGAYASPGLACGASITGGTAGQVIWVKYNATAYSLSSTNNVAGGRCTMPSSIATPGMLRGYTTTRGDLVLASRPILQLGANSMTGLSGGGDNVITNFVIDCNSHTSSTGLSLSAFNIASYIKIIGSCTTGASITSNGMAQYLEVNNGGKVTLTGGILNYSEIHGNTSAVGISASGSPTVIANTLVYGNGGDGISASAGNGIMIFNVTTYGNTGHGVSITDAGATTIVNSYAEANNNGGTGYGFNVGSGSKAWLINCGAYNNPSGTYSTNFNSNQVVSFQTLTSSAFVAAGSSNFDLNLTATGGALLRAAGFPSTFPSGSTANQRDIGAPQSIVQHVFTSAH